RAQDVARPGDWAAPLEVPALPFVHAGSTVGRRATAMRYAPRLDISEGGPEVVYRVSVPAAGRLLASVEGDRDPVDVDVHVLRTLALDATGAATDGLAHGNRKVELDVEPGPLFVIIDTFQAARHAGP